MALVHKHLIVRAECKSAPKSEQLIVEWFQQLVDKIGMKIMLGPYAKYCEMVGNRGLTCAAIIETSHIVMHTWDEEDPNTIQLDVYSCGCFNVDDIVEHLRMFDLTKIEFKYLDRENDLRMLDQGVVDLKPSALQLSFDRF